jgi:hypothetical protein
LLELVIVKHLAQRLLPKSTRLLKKVLFKKVLDKIPLIVFNQRYGVFLGWFHEETEILKTILPMKMGKRWRTYADKNPRELKGNWKMEIKGMDGNLLKDIKFKVE